MINTALIHYDEAGDILDNPYWYSRVSEDPSNSIEPATGFAAAVDLPKYRTSTVVAVKPPEGDYRKIVFRNDGNNSMFEQWFPLNYERFHYARCPQRGERMTWENIETVTQEA